MSDGVFAVGVIVWRVIGGSPVGSSGTGGSGTGGIPVVGIIVVGGVADITAVEGNVDTVRACCDSVVEGCTRGSCVFGRGAMESRASVTVVPSCCVVTSVAIDGALTGGR